jgi:hypothetical protein
MNAHRALALRLGMISAQTPRLLRGKTAAQFSGSCLWQGG